jgi:hypothetical protein
MKKMKRAVAVVVVATGLFVSSIGPTSAQSYPISDCYARGGDRAYKVIDNPIGRDLYSCVDKYGPFNSLSRVLYYFWA